MSAHCIISVLPGPVSDGLFSSLWIIFSCFYQFLVKVARGCEQVVSQGFLLLLVETGFFHRTARRAFRGPMDLKHRGKVYWSENERLSPSPSVSSMTRGSAPSSVEEVQPLGREPATTATRPRRTGTQRCRTPLCVNHPWEGPLLRLHWGPHCCYREEAQESLRAVMGPPPIQSLPFPRLDSSPFWSPSRLLLHTPQQRIFSFIGPPFWNLGEQPVVP